MNNGTVPQFENQLILKYTEFALEKAKHLTQLLDLLATQEEAEQTIAQQERSEQTITASSASREVLQGNSRDQDSEDSDESADTLLGHIQFLALQTKSALEYILAEQIAIEEQDSQPPGTYRDSTASSSSAQATGSLPSSRGNQVPLRTKLEINDRVEILSDHQGLRGVRGSVVKLTGKRAFIKVDGGHSVVSRAKKNVRKLVSSDSFIYHI